MGSMARELIRKEAQKYLSRAILRHVLLTSDAFNSSVGVKKEKILRMSSSGSTDSPKKHGGSSRSHSEKRLSVSNTTCPCSTSDRAVLFKNDVASPNSIDDNPILESNKNE